MKRLSLWPQSLFGRLIAASIVALLVAQIASVVLLARERERFILQGSVREWSRRIAEVTTMLQSLDDSDRAVMVARLTARPWRFGHRPPAVIMFRDGPVPAPDIDWIMPRGPGGLTKPEAMQGRVPPDLVPPDGGGLLPPPGGEGLVPPGVQPLAPPAEGLAPPVAQRPVAGGGGLTAPGAEDLGPPDAERRGPVGGERAGAKQRGAVGQSSSQQGAVRPDHALQRPLRKEDLAVGSNEGHKRSGAADEHGARDLALPSGQTPSGSGSRGPFDAGSRSARLDWPGGPPPEDPRSLLLRATTYQVIVPFTKVGDFEEAFEQQLRTTLGPGFAVHVAPTADPSKKAISISGPLFSESRDNGTELYDASVKFPDGYTALFRVTRLARGAPLPRGLFANLAFLVVVMSVALFVTARSITRPLSELARAADSVGRDLRQPKLAERGARELRNAARAFNTMQDRLQRYLDSRSRVLAAMSHDLKTPLTRLRLQVEMLEDSAAQARIGKQLDEMESMVHGALALFRGLDDNEAFTPLDVNEMLATLQSEFAEMNARVAVEGRATRSILGKPQALRRCLTNLIANAVKFGSQAWVIIEDGAALIIRVRDDGPGIPEDQLERVFEPFYRVESSRNRDTGGTGLGLSIARDVIQAHGGSLVLSNLPVRGLEATVTLPRT